MRMDAREISQRKNRIRGLPGHTCKLELYHKNYILQVFLGPISNIIQFFQTNFGIDPQLTTAMNIL